MSSSYSLTRHKLFSAALLTLYLNVSPKPAEHYEDRSQSVSGQRVLVLVQDTTVSRLRCQLYRKDRRQEGHICGQNSQTLCRLNYIHDGCRIVRNKSKDSYDQGRVVAL
ncbi:hypothetical protein DOTSEDRAFT_74841 [Dothistroma septosporum NZE10]|uniref:Uncharacterized protein n=1 Tax=Dothistroma septosporum (strain NZE10 / CBS 128990) TaxID=675120 RepID=N1PCE2_DOTSN|nr:hypothetical protein DOTSEDRAFT_74841 [Dothistroma septosporum NZE10]